MPVVEHDIHPSTQHGEDFRYGCHNKPRPKELHLIAGGQYGELYPYRFSTTCRFDMSFTDPGCRGCWWQGLGEKYAEEIRRNGK